VNPVEEHVQNLANSSLSHQYLADNGEAVQSDLKRVSLAGRQITLSADMTPGEQSLIKEAIQATQPRTKECFTNALKLWEYDHRFSYAEGYASGPPRTDIVVEHAWSMLNEKKIVDPTVDLEHYYGVVISSERILERNTGADISPEGVICRRENRDFLREQGYTKYGSSE
jgi:hypothetical protein